MAIRIAQIDAFTTEPFRGNSAAVCLLEQQADDQWMQNVAMEMNLAETAFLVPEKNGFHLRWFTPTTEVDLCGHATLASAHYLYEHSGQKDQLQQQPHIEFYTRSGTLTAARKDGGWIELNFPTTPAKPDECPDAIHTAIDVPFHFVGRNAFDYLIELESDAAVRELEPKTDQLKKLHARGLVVTAKATDGADYDFISRGFFPGAGIEEDPVTGSAHCMLAPYWMEKLGKSDMIGYQASKRGGYVRTILQGERTLLLGKAVTTIEGTLFY